MQKKKVDKNKKVLNKIINNNCNIIYSKKRIYNDFKKKLII